MSTSELELTSSEEIAAFRAGEKMMELIGYIDAIDGLRAVKTNQQWILKCVLNNDNGTRIRCVWWGDQALDYQDKLRLNDVVEITGGTISAVNKRFFNPSENVVPVEFNFQPKSKFTIHGSFRGAQYSQVPRQVTNTTIADMLAFEGVISLQGYIKTEISVVTRGTSSSGNFVLAYDEYRVSTQIAEFTNDENLVKGALLQVHGTAQPYKSQEGHFLLIKNMDDIEVIPQAEPLCRTELRRAILPPRPKITDDTESEKKRFRSE